MCGRYTLEINECDEKMLRMIELCNRDAVPDQKIAHRAEVLPGDNAPAIISINHRPTAISMQWGFAKENGGLVINARSEDAGDRKLFRSLIHGQRCALPAAGYYEWRDGDHLRHVISRENGRALYLAGLYRSDEKGRLHFVVMTRNAFGPHAKIHGRMPCLLFSKEEARLWISGTMPIETLRAPIDEDLHIEAQGFEQLCMDFDD